MGGHVHHVSCPVTQDIPSRVLEEFISEEIWKNQKDRLDCNSMYFDRNLIAGRLYLRGNNEKIEEYIGI